jgi:hypothetical protein
MMRTGSLIVGPALVAVGVADAADAPPLVVDRAWVEATTETLVLRGAARMPDADAMQMGLQVGRGHGGNANLIASLVSRAGPEPTARRDDRGMARSGRVLDER